MPRVRLSDIRLSNKEKEILLAYADCNMNKLETARVLFMSKGSIPYHLDKIKERTGYDPKNFYDLVELLYVVSSEEHVEQEEAI